MTTRRFVDRWRRRVALSLLSALLLLLCVARGQLHVPGGDSDEFVIGNEDESSTSASAIAVPSTHAASERSNLLAAAASRAEAALDAAADWHSELTELNARASSDAVTAATTTSPEPAVAAAPTTAAAAAVATVDPAAQPPKPARVPTRADALDDEAAAAAAAAWAAPDGLADVRVVDGTVSFVPPSIRDLLQREYVRRRFGDVFKVSCDCALHDGRMRYDAPEPNPPVPPVPARTELQTTPLEPMRDIIKNVFLEIDSEQHRTPTPTRRSNRKPAGRSTDDLVDDFHALFASRVASKPVRIN